MGVYYRTYTKAGQFIRKVAEEDVGTLTNREYVKVVGVFVSNDGKLAFQKRAATQMFGGMLNVFTGKIENGESPENAKNRELCEELPITETLAKRTIFVGSYPVSIVHGSVRYNAIVHFYYLNTDGVKLYPNDDETEEIVRLPFREARAIIAGQQNFVFPYDGNMRDVLEIVECLMGE